MAIFGSRQKYGRVAQALHWLTAILVLAAFLASAGGPEARVYAPERDSQRILHESLGIAVLIIVAVRLAWRAFDRAPDEPPMPSWMTRSAMVSHWLLYLLLLAVPLTAIIGAWAEGHPLNLYVLPELASPFGGDSRLHDFGAWITGVHTWLGDAILWVAGFHAAAALGHHFVLKDRILVSMLPWG